MKISPATLVNKKCQSLSDFWPPNVKEGSPACDPGDATTPPVIAEEQGECEKQPSATP